MASSLNEYLKRKVRGGRIKKDNKDDEGSSRRKGRTCGVDLPSNGSTTTTKSATTKPLQARKHPDPNESAISSPRRESLDLAQLKPSGPPARTNSSSASTLATSHSSLASSYSSLPATSSSSPVRKAPRRKVSRPASFSASPSAPLSPRQERRVVTPRSGGGAGAGAPKRNSTSPLKATSPRRSTPKATVGGVPSNVSPNRAPSGGTSPPLASKVTPTNGNRAPRPVVPSFVSSPSLNGGSTPIIKRSSLRLSRSASVTGKSSAVATGAPRSPRAAPLRASSAQLGVSPRKPGGAGGGGARVPLRSASSQSVGAPNRPLVQPKRSTMSEATLRSEPSYTKRQPIPPGKSGGRMPLPPPSASGYGSDATSVRTEPSPRLRAMSTTSGAIGMRRPVPGRTAAGAPRSHHARSFSSSNQTTYSSPPPTTTTSLGAKLNAQKNKLASKQQQQQQAGGNGGDITDDLLDDYLDIMSEYGETSSVTGW